jgi:hypothetical protein
LVRQISDDYRRFVNAQKTNVNYELLPNELTVLKAALSV